MSLREEKNGGGRVVCHCQLMIVSCYAAGPVGARFGHFAHVLSPEPVSSWDFWPFHPQSPFLPPYLGLDMGVCLKGAKNREKMEAK